MCKRGIGQFCLNSLFWITSQQFLEVFFFSSIYLNYLHKISHIHFFKRANVSKNSLATITKITYIIIVISLGTSNNSDFTNHWYIFWQMNWNEYSIWKLAGYFQKVIWSSLDLYDSLHFLYLLTYRTCNKLKWSR